MLYLGQADRRSAGVGAVAVGVASGGATYVTCSKEKYVPVTARAMF